MEPENKTIGKESLFNAGIAKLERIDSQRRIVNQARLENNWQILSSALINIRNEVHDRMNPDEKDKADDMETAMRTEVISYRQKKSKGIRNMVINSKLMDGYNRYLSDLEMKYGLSLPNKPNESDSADE